MPDLVGASTYRSARLAAAVVLAATWFCPVAAAQEPGDADRSAGGSPGRPADTARALFEQGLEVANQGRWVEAREYFEQSVSLVPRSSALVNLATALIRVGEGKRALVALDRLATH